MKISLATFIALVSSTHAFAPAFVARSETVLKMSRPDSSSAIAEAMRLSKEFGPTSVEARLAWEAVEEMDSSDTSAAYKGGIAEEECQIDTENLCKEYEDKIKELSFFLEKEKPNLKRVKTLAAEIQAIKLVAPKSKTSPDSPILKKALIDAKAASDYFGSDSSEAKLAWETVEEIASSDNSEAFQDDLDDECLVETIEACEALEELSRVIILESTSSRYSG